VIMPGHVSLSSMTSGRGESGTVQWGNACRARALLAKVTKSEDDDSEPDKAVRVLQVKKANWGPDENEIKLRWSRGLFVLDTGERDDEIEPTWKLGDINALLNDEEEFLRMLDRMAAVKVNVSPHPTAQNNAAKVFSEDSRCKLRGKAGRPKLKAAM